jgi:ATP-dependent Lon protease
MMNKKKFKNKSTQTDPDLDEEFWCEYFEQLQEQNSMKRKRRCSEPTNYTEEESMYFYSLSRQAQKAITQNEERLQNLTSSGVPLRFKIIDSKMDDKLKAHCMQKLNALSRMDNSTGEYNKLMNYIECISKLPIGSYKNILCNNSSSKSEINVFLNSVKEKLDNTVFGHEEAKEQILKLLAQWISNPDSKGLVLGIEGDMGVGKTTLVKEGICKALNIPFGFIPLGGASDGSYLVGHSYTYEGSRWGRIVDILTSCQCMNPILYFDELDKVSDTRYGEEIKNILIHLTDSSQNTSFHDKYFSDIELDLSRCLIIFSYNDANLINPILRDRMVTIRANGYTTSDKINIVYKYMLAELQNKYNFKEEDISMSKDILTYIITKTPKENGVRNLKRSLDCLFGHVNLCRVLGRDIYMKADSPITFPLEINKKYIDFIIKSDDKNDNVSLNYMYM